MSDSERDTSADELVAGLPDAADSPVSVLYASAVESCIELFRTLDAEQWATPVPCLPGWDVRDVLSHVSGIPDDAFAGRMDGVATEPWTASQVERNRAASVDELLDRWTEQYRAFGDVLDGLDEQRPPIDCHSHEHDVRHALDLAGNRGSLVIEARIGWLATGLECSHDVVVELDDGRRFISPGTSPTATGGAVDTVTVSGLSAFEVFRSRLGRRTRAQVEGYAWAGPAELVDATIDAWFEFGPATAPITE